MTRRRTPLTLAEAAGRLEATMRPLTPFDQARLEAFEAGYTTVANLHTGTDETLVRVAQDAGRYVYIGHYQPQGRQVHRPSPWRNPYGRAYGDRTIRVALYAAYLDGNPAPSPQLPKLPAAALLQRLHELTGMVLCCWCAPALCHGEILLARLHDGSLERYRAAVQADTAPTCT